MRIKSTNRLPVAWVPATAFDAAEYGDVEVQVVGTPAVAYAPTRSLDGTNFVACNAYDKDGATVTSITAAGIYFLPGGGKLQMLTGSGSTFTLRAGA